MLALPDLNSRFEVIYDACRFGLGAVLCKGGDPLHLKGNACLMLSTTGEKELLLLCMLLSFGGATWMGLSSQL